MLLRDLVRLTLGSLRAHRLRTFLAALGIAVGIAAVILLTSIGEGIHRFVLSEFTQFGTNLIAINPGKATTHGAAVGIFGTVRPLSIEDAEALRRLPYVHVTNPSVQGNAEVGHGGRTRRTTIYGVGPDFPEALQMKVAIGRFLPADNPYAARAFVVLGAKVREELFGSANPLGSRLEVGGDRYRVIGVMEPKGEVLGIDLDDSVFIPVGRALELFNVDSLQEIQVVYDPAATADQIADSVRRLLIARHGRDDVTITTQQQMLDVLGSVLDLLTFAVGALGGISLLVGGVGILTIMTIAVSERTAEIGLLRALGAEQQQVLSIFLGEAAMLAGAGGLAGLALGAGIAEVLTLLVPALPVHTPWSFAFLAEALSVGIGLLAGVLPARAAARLDPVESLRAE